MSAELERSDIQGFVLKHYGRYGHFKARFALLAIAEEHAGRELVEKLLPYVTTAEPWTPKTAPPSALNVAFTYEGLKHLGVPELSLHSFPDDYSMGMLARRKILGDERRSAPEHWDAAWQSPNRTQPVHVLVTISGRTVGDVEERFELLCKFVAESKEKVALVEGHGPTRAKFQEASAIFQNGQPTPKEHFGYTDGLSDPYFLGCDVLTASLIGGGKPMGGDPRTSAGWAPLETGEFVLGHKDEAGECPPAPVPGLLSRNGTFLVFRKLHQNVAAFDAFLQTAAEHAALRRMIDDHEERVEWVAAKMVGRWRNGTPLSTFPTWKEAQEFAARLAQARGGSPDAFRRLSAELLSFDYHDDLDGSRCPTGAHIRRINPRGSLEFGHRGAFATPGALDNRRRIIRRGLPYGDSQENRSDEGEHGIVLMILCASIKRQFEFVQQQWVHYGNDFKLGNDQDPLLGNHDPNNLGRLTAQADPKGKHPPVLLDNIPTFVETRGGDYFFVPSLTALQMIAAGTVDPT